MSIDEKNNSIIKEYLEINEVLSRKIITLNEENNFLVNKLNTILLRSSYVNNLNISNNINSYNLNTKNTKNFVDDKSEIIFKNNNKINNLNNIIKKYNDFFNTIIVDYIDENEEYFDAFNIINNNNQSFDAIFNKYKENIIDKLNLFYTKHDTLANNYIKNKLELNLKEVKIKYFEQIISNLNTYNKNHNIFSNILEESNNNIDNFINKISDNIDSNDIINESTITKNNMKEYLKIVLNFINKSKPKPNKKKYCKYLFTINNKIIDLKNMGNNLKTYINKNINIINTDITRITNIFLNNNYIVNNIYNKVTIFSDYKDKIDDCFIKHNKIDTYITDIKQKILTINTNNSNKDLDKTIDNIIELSPNNQITEYKKKIDLFEKEALKKYITNYDMNIKSIQNLNDQIKLLLKNRIELFLNLKELLINI